MVVRERYVWVCTNRRPDGHPRGSCAEKGSEALLVTLKSKVAEAGLAKTVRVMASGCIDVCEEGCAVAVMPDGTLVGLVTEADIATLVEGLRTPGGVGASETIAPRVIPLGTTR